MRKTLLLFFSFLCGISSVQAQYFNAKKGTVAYYVTTDHKNNKTLKDTATVIDVKDESKRLTIKLAFRGDNYDAQSIQEGTNIETYVYYKDRDITELILLDGEMESEPIRREIYSRYPADKQDEAEKEYQQYSKVVRAEGRISVLLKEDAKEEEELPSRSYLQKAGPMTAKGFLKGKYKGRERVHTPAGDFDCIKVYTESRAKIMFFSDKEYAMDWYAKGIGLVKSEVLTKRGKVLSTMLLQAIKE